MDKQKEDFIERALNVLNEALLEALQTLGPFFLAVVMGGRALSIITDRSYAIKSIDWDLAVISRTTKYNNNEARDYVGKLLVDSFKKFRQHQKFRLGLVEASYKTKILDIRYEVSSQNFVSYTGVLYKVGHINLVTNRWGSLSIIDIAPILFNSDDIITIDKINYAGPSMLERELLQLLRLPQYKKKSQAQERLNIIRDAYTSNRLNCNYYLVKQLASKRCKRGIVLGPLVPGDKRKFPRFDISPFDIKAHLSYINNKSLTQQQIIKAYTYNKSSSWNNLLTHNALFPQDKIPIIPEIDQLQSLILGAPPLQKDMTVYYTTRYFFFPRENRSNFDYKEGETIHRIAFTSSSYDNHYNPRAFIDLFAPGIAFVIRVPAGSKVLIIGELSTVPSEREVLFPIGASFHIDRTAWRQITYEDKGGIWYDEMKVYFCTYIPTKGNVVDYQLTGPKSHEQFDHLIINEPHYAKIFASLWNLNQLI